jgi:hypothetical protein
MLRTGGDLDTRCENCHKVYWYPMIRPLNNLREERRLQGRTGPKGGRKEIAQSQSQLRRLLMKGLVTFVRSCSCGCNLEEGARALQSHNPQAAR